MNGSENTCSTAAGQKCVNGWGSRGDQWSLFAYRCVCATERIFVNCVWFIRTLDLLGHSRGQCVEVIFKMAHTQREKSRKYFHGVISKSAWANMCSCCCKSPEGWKHTEAWSKSLPCVCTFQRNDDPSSRKWTGIFGVHFCCNISRAKLCPCVCVAFSPKKRVDRKITPKDPSPPWRCCQQDHSQLLSDNFLLGSLIDCRTLLWLHEVKQKRQNDEGWKRWKQQRQK